MKLQELKHRVYEEWKDVHFFNSALAQPEVFKTEIRTFGDLRRKSTWEKALIQFAGMNASGGWLDASNLILFSLNFTPDRWDYEYRHQIFDAFLSEPNALELIKTGLEQLFSADFTPQERSEANGFFELVQEQSERRRIHGQPAGLIGRIQELAGATAG